MQMMYKVQKEKNGYTRETEYLTKWDLSDSF